VANLALLALVVTRDTSDQVLFKEGEHLFEDVLKKSRLTNQIKCEVAVLQHEELAISETTSFQQRMPLFAFQLIKHFVYFSAENQCSSQSRFKLKDWVAFIDSHELEFAQEVERLCANCLLRRAHFQLQIFGDKDEFFSHAMSTRLTIHAEVTELELVFAVCGFINLPRHQRIVPLSSRLHRHLARGALVHSIRLLLLPFPFLLHESALTLRRILVVAQGVQEFVQHD